ncbi:MAG: TRAP transporter fused permease subunit [Hyphomicrobiales bacterium]|nr:TRAP transporter fused permease subunit [Hyphomicrobiales bacterium]
MKPLSGEKIPSGAAQTAPETFSKLTHILIVITALAMVAIHVLQAAQFVFPSGQFRNFHLGFAVLLSCLMLIESTKSGAVFKKALLAVMAVITIAVMTYIHIEYRELTEVRSFLPNQTDILVAVLLLGVTLIVSGIQWGWTIPALALLGLAYGYWGYLLPGDILVHAGLSPQRLMAYTSIPYFQGLLGGLTSLSGNTIFMFMLFGGALKATGAIDFIVKIGFALGRRSRAGPALVAVASSGLMGTVSGSTVANVASTGAITIPLMKRYGFKPHFSGAVEAVSSTGGQLMPPVMGLAAFLIVGITGIPYAEVMIAAIAPAIIYYVFLMGAVHLRAVNLGLDARDAAMEGDDGTPFASAAMRQWHLAAAIIALIYLLVTGIPAGTAALYAFALLLGLDFLMCAAANRFSLDGFKTGMMRIVDAFVEGAKSGAMVATVIAVIGVLIEILTITGFAQKLSFAMLELSDGRLVTLSVIVAISCLVFGLGLPTSASYFIVALFGAPALVQLGVPLLAAHMFVFYFANLSAITPPVAVAALVGANIAKANFWATGFTAVRLGLPGFLLPFLFIFEPQILGVTGTVFDQLIAIVQALLAIAALNFAIEGRMVGTLRAWERALLLLCSIGLLFPNEEASLTALAVAAAVGIRHAIAARASGDA